MQPTSKHSTVPLILVVPNHISTLLRLIRERISARSLWFSNRKFESKCCWNSGDFSLISVADSIIDSRAKFFGKSLNWWAIETCRQNGHSLQKIRSGCRTKTFRSRFTDRMPAAQKSRRSRINFVAKWTRQRFQWSNDKFWRWICWKTNLNKA